MMPDKKVSYFPFSFPLSLEAWEIYDLFEPLDIAEGRRKGEKLSALRRVGDRINERDFVAGDQPRPVNFWELLSMDMIQEALGTVLDLFCRKIRPGSLEEGVSRARGELGPEAIERTTRIFADLYPPEEVQLGRTSREHHLKEIQKGGSREFLVIREMILLFFAAGNPAFQPFKDLFDDEDLKEDSRYLQLVASLEVFFDSLPPLEMTGRKLFQTLREPMMASPDSLQGQLEYILANWATWLPEEMRSKLLVTKGILGEETWVRGPVDGRAEIMFSAGREGKDVELPEEERFSLDLDWMPNLVMLAKSVWVWMDQLSGRYGRSISRLDEIPDEELDRLAGWGFTGLWLIGLWERSPASMRIKQVMGNPEAMASAYSLYDYVISRDLGGEPALVDLKERAGKRGIRLASDMVPNHMGIYSRWVVEHPGWFLQLDSPPFPGYSFTGEDLSPDERVSIHIEDGYYSRRDAAVVFKRVDNMTGETRFIYHGNDGTHMPWNDTAQLNYLNPEVREAVIRTILHVAGLFPIIRFDAAMTLAKKHYQRLWFPNPGEGGAIPSRAEHGMTRGEFDAHFPGEFWREVVDRVAREAPDTLLLAEAFWLMEGYFVRTLGMHRVYNSAFMNMLKTEDNAGYRSTIKNVLRFSPEILKRFVNFMNNPDEKTAVEQFGKGDKYFGTAVMMATMPGLPMFGHGQVEGLAEQYGMEYRRAYWGEQVDQDMVDRHAAEIFPLMKKRFLFSGVEEFFFYDFNTPEGRVDENVFSYSNRSGQERALIIYNNSLNTTRGNIKNSVVFNAGGPGGEDLVQRTLVEGLGLNKGEDCYYIFKDHREKVEYLRRGSQIHEEGFVLELPGYQYRAFLEINEETDEDGSWRRLWENLQGRGVPDILLARRELVLAPLHQAAAGIFSGSLMRSLFIWESTGAEDNSEGMNRIQEALDELLRSAREQGLPGDSRQKLLEDIKSDADSLAILDRILGQGRVEGRVPDFLAEVYPPEEEDRSRFKSILMIWIILRRLETIFISGESLDTRKKWIDEWLLTPVITQGFMELGRDRYEAYLDTRLVRGMIVYQNLLASGSVAGLEKGLGELLNDPGLADYLSLNSHQGILWFSKERMEELIYWLFTAELFSGWQEHGFEGDDKAREILRYHKNLSLILDAASESGYKVREALEHVRQSSP